ncbi:dnaJ homolog subfamily C member 30, mitochondrial-like [Neocloeon triangulifer]|uniref:dnaJ homolog subfamily C member 30, mitochondrial-like n=1 Tax=Neocloeon triangulifer TaxID=2078957 RepID=UPI00286EDB96|nr:dnaJ homolog subfamily C member 30, mitochondrial-like [Neocloeon triangulifer]
MQSNVKSLLEWSCQQCILKGSRVRVTSHRSISLRPGQKTYYDSLGVSASATQGEIKAAYYKLSKIYHPDRNKGCQDAAENFRKITEAYETVGNVQRRRIYDKGGMYDTVVDTQETQEQAAVSKFYKSRGMTYSGKTPIYDFDEWSREHYGKTFARREKAKAQYHSRMNVNTSNTGSSQSISFMVLVALSFFITAGYIGIWSENKWDRVDEKRRVK